MSLVAAATPSVPLTVGDLRGSPGRRRREHAVRAILFGAAATSVLISLGIVLSLVGEAISFLTSIELSSLWSRGWAPRRGLYDIRTIVVGTLAVTVVAMALAAPVGLGAAIYLSEYARPGARRVLKPMIEILAGIPSVVIGFFALSFISPNIVQKIFTEADPKSYLAAGLGVGILIIPLVASIAEDALRSVPNALREASSGLGARKLTTTVKVVLPAAVSGLVAAGIVGTSRAIGETMVVAIAAGSAGAATFTWKLTEGGQTMTGAMASLATGTDQVRGASAAFSSLFFVGLLLFVITLSLNAIAGRFVRRVRQRY